jgi:hypothetical protein
MGPDWTVAIDDALTERFLACLMCGQRQERRRSLDLVLSRSRPMLAARCLRCAAQDQAGTQLLARLAARERPGR